MSTRLKDIVTSFSFADVNYEVLFNSEISLADRQAGRWVKEIP